MTGEQQSVEKAATDEHALTLLCERLTVLYDAVRDERFRVVDLGDMVAVCEMKMRQAEEYLRDAWQAAERALVRARSARTVHNEEEESP